MTFLAPLYLAAAAFVAVGVIALHFLARLRPRPASFPTARFIPLRTARAPARSWRPTDLPLLAMRVLAVLLVGAAFARPQLQSPRRAVARVVAVDVSRAVGSVDEVRDSATALLTRGDVLIAFDSAARAVSAGPAESLAALRRAGARGSLSAALVVAARAARRLRDRSDSVELVIISPLAVEEWDAATAGLRATWVGRARLVRVVAADAPPPPAIVVRGAADDPVRATMALAGHGAGQVAVRLVRGASTHADSAWVADSAGVLVHWPADLTDAGWPARTSRDTVGAVVAGGTVVVAPFERVARPPPGQVVARWVDGEPAAVERTVGAGCRRDVAIPVRAEGDLALRESFRRLVIALTAPCGGQRAFAPIPDSAVALLRGEGGLVAARSLAGNGGTRIGLDTWLLVVATALVVAEPLARRAKAVAA